MNARLTAAAQRELNAALKRYLDDAGRAVAERFDERVQHVLRLICQMPETGSPISSGLRIWPLQRFEYSLVYRVDPNEIVVIAVAHQRRAVEYWAGRK
jgi:plasmid stabilization system protein ParE